MKALWNNTVIAQADNNDIIEIEGRSYFPPTAIKKAYFHESSSTSICPRKWTASYYSIDVDGKENPDAARYYPQPSEAAKQIKDYVAFWRGVEIVE